MNYDKIRDAYQSVRYNAGRVKDGVMETVNGFTPKKAFYTGVGALAIWGLTSMVEPKKAEALPIIDVTSAYSIGDYDADGDLDSLWSWTVTNNSLGGSEDDISTLLFDSPSDMGILAAQGPTANWNSL